MTVKGLSRLASQGPFFPTVSSQIAGPDADWLGSGALTADDAGFALVTVPTFGQSDFLVGRDYGFTISSSATIEGVEVELNDPTISSNSPALDVYLTKDGTTTVGSALSSALAGPGWETLGSSTNLWGTTLTPSEVNSSNFGVLLRVRELSETSSSAINIDAVRVTVHYGIYQFARPDGVI